MRLISYVFIVLFLTGCQTVKPSQKTAESAGDVQKALTSVAGAISGQDMDKEDLKNLNRQLRSDEKARSAVKTLTDSLGGQPVQIKYCPLTGKRYASTIEFCPEHGVKLEFVE